MLLYFIHSCVLCSEFFGHVSNKRLTAVLTSSWFYTFLFVEKSKSLHGIKHWYSQLYDHVYLHSSHRSMLIMCRARKIYRPLHCTLVSWTWSKLFFQKGKSLIWRQETENSPLNLVFCMSIFATSLFKACFLISDFTCCGFSCWNLILVMPFPLRMLRFQNLAFSPCKGTCTT